MARRKRLIVIGLSIFIVFGVIFALVSTTWNSELRVPTGQASQTVAFKCGPLWGSDYARGPSVTTFPVAGTPCGTRRQNQVIVDIDIVLSLAGIVVVTNWGRRRRATPVTAI